MIVRIWRTSVAPGRAEDYRRFARERSLPMFRGHDGFLGALFTEDGPERMVVTLWADQRSAEALAESPVYLGTVAELEGSGILAGEQGLEASATHLIFLDAELVAAGKRPDGVSEGGEDQRDGGPSRAAGTVADER